MQERLGEGNGSTTGPDRQGDRDVAGHVANVGRDVGAMLPAGRAPRLILRLILPHGLVDFARRDRRRPWRETDASFGEPAWRYAKVRGGLRHAEERRREAV